MSAPQARDAWEYDDAHSACQQWITAWRHLRPDAPRPPLRFAGHLGRCATAISAEGVGKVDLIRLFAAAGFDAACVCGEMPDGLTADKADAA